MRGENVALLGEIDLDKIEPETFGLTKVNIEEILEMQVLLVTGVWVHSSL